MKAADAIQLGGSGAPGFFRLALLAAETPVVIGKKTAKDFVGGFQIGSTGQAKLAGKAILKGAQGRSMRPLASVVDCAAM
jgi:hypothetical protein